MGRESMKTTRLLLTAFSRFCATLDTAVVIKEIRIYHDHPPALTCITDAPLKRTSQ
ncbi:hypothetical protein E2C01_082838 [Portunus trituberculatus]|uniref:Uncharacterized protein n=1 Tax=Portunus trituberculatus TaxID=210409 RepID=A0A5B7J665_PORTR|nr:hypothetical protein [Portunus trituberculatus]